MINDLKELLIKQKFTDDYSEWHHYYDTALVSFYVQRLSKQCQRFNIPNVCNNFYSWAILTDKFALTDTSNRATITRNVKDTHWVEDSYYQIARYIYNNPDQDKQMIKQYLSITERCVPKAFAMQYLVGAIEATEVETLQLCVDKIKTVRWKEAGNKSWEVADNENKLKVFGLDE